MEKQNNLKCFISYARESKEHKEWVRKLAEKLQNSGVYTLLDQWDMRPGGDVTQYMESSVRESQFVLLVCTPAFCNKANKGEGGVGFEKMIITGEIIEKLPSEKFIPILRSGKGVESIPSYLKSKYWLDFRKEELFEDSFQELLRHILNEPLYKRPSLGTPEFGFKEELHNEQLRYNKAREETHNFFKKANISILVISHSGKNKMQVDINDYIKDDSTVENFKEKIKEDYGIEIIYHYI